MIWFKVYDASTYNFTEINSINSYTFNQNSPEININEKNKIIYISEFNDINFQDIFMLAIDTLGS